MNLQKSVVLVVVVLVATVLACQDGGPANTGGPTAEELMPAMEGYQWRDTQDVQATISNLAGGAAVVTGRPDMAVVIKTVDVVSQCYQDKGAVETRVYSDKEEPLSSGAVIIIDENMISDPSLLLDCTIAAGSSFQASDLQPCAYNYTLETSENAFHIAYVGSTGQICADFCNNLQGCMASDP